MLTVRENIAQRLKYEFDRRNFSTDFISQKCGLEGKIVADYLQATREINIEEIKKICYCLNVNPTRLLYCKNYPKVNLSYRNSARNVQFFAALIEDIFLLLKDSFPIIKCEEYKRSNSTNSLLDNITDAASYSNSLKSLYQTPFDFYKAYSIPVLPLYKPEIEFDAFLLRENNKMLICINTSKPPHRIKFSLAHEIAHILFDKTVSVPIDTLITNFYWRSSLATHEIPEFFAYKFAEFYLIPFDDVCRIAKNWPNINLKQAQGLLDQSISTKEVLANAIWDALKILNSWSNNDEEYETDKVNYYTIFNQLKELKNSSNTSDIFQFIYECQKNFDLYIDIEKNKLSDEIYEYINGALKVEQ